MSWATIRLIWFRELRDQMRDRRTVVMLIILPFVPYPILGLLAARFAVASSSTRPGVVGIRGIEYLPSSWRGTPAALAGAATAANPAATVGGLAAQAAAFRVCCEELLGAAEPPLVIQSPDGQWKFASAVESSPEPASLSIRPVLPGEDTRALFRAREIDALLCVPSDFAHRLEQAHPVSLTVETRDDSEMSEHAGRELRDRLASWKRLLKEARLRRKGLPPDFDNPFSITEGEALGRPLEVSIRGMAEQVVRLVPFILVMWALAGALYPAVDVCAGEKERGTMETLLISPASREEIVLGKFLTIWVFSAASSLWNLACMAGTAWGLGRVLPRVALPPMAVVWCVLAVLPLTAFFSAVCLAMGVYARSSKEGQYYLMPLFLLTMPLILLTLAPGVELSAFYSLVPVTGVALLMQRLLAPASHEGLPWLYVLSVLAAVVLYSALALRWAVEQFKREEVLFREAERLDVGLWLRRLFREKEARTSVGQALFCFALLLALRWIFFGTAGPPPSAAQAATGYLALVAPPLFMAILLTRRPTRALGLRSASPRSLARAALLGILLIPCLLVLIPLGHRLLPGLELPGPLVNGEVPSHAASGPMSWKLLVASALLPAIGEELAFRGFILSGFRGRFAPRPAVILAACLYGLYFMNVFWFLPAFGAGAALAVLRLAGNSVVPGIAVHFLGRAALTGLVAGSIPTGTFPGGEAGVALISGVSAAVIARLMIRLARDVAALPERRVEPAPEE